MIRKRLRLAVARALIVGSLMLAVGVFPFLVSPRLVTEGLPRAKTLSGMHALFYSLFPFLLAAFALGGLAFFIWGLCLLVKPGWHPTLRRLGKYGPPREVAGAIDAELADADTTRIGEPIRSFRLARADQTHDPVFVTRSWVVQPVGLGVKVVRLDDIVWVRGQGFAFARMVAAQGQAVGVKLRDGSEEQFVLSAANAPRLVLEIVRRLPWVHSGSDEVLERRWQSERQEFLAAFDRQREQVQALPPERREELIREKSAGSS
jgi:hypothetical protein